MKRFCTSLISLLIAASCAAKPNIIYLMADDIGAEAFEMYGADRNDTPFIEGLADKGMMFTDFWVNPQCTQTRYSMYTGKNLYRAGPNYENAFTQTHLGQMLQAEGYITGHYGKPDGMINFGVGWDYYFEDIGTDPYGKGDGVIQNGSVAANDAEYTSYIAMRECLEFVSTQEEPFFLMYHSRNPRWPYHIPPLYRDPPEQSPTDASDPLYGVYGQLKYWDHTTSNIWQAVVDRGIVSNTIFIITGDNGGPVAWDFSFQGQTIQGGKQQPDDTGSVVPFIAYWPGVIPAGTTNNTPSYIHDLAPTLLDIVGADMASAYTSYQMDGVTMYPGLKDPTKKHRRGFVQETTHSDTGIRNIVGEIYKISNNDPNLTDETGGDYRNWYFYKRNWPFHDIYIAPENMTQEQKVEQARLLVLLDNLTNSAYAGGFLPRDNEGVFVK